MTIKLKNFWKDQDGAVTVDWMLLTAAILTLGIVVGYSVSDGATTMAEDVGDELETATVPSVTF